MAYRSAPEKERRVVGARQTSTRVFGSYYSFVMFVDFCYPNRFLATEHTNSIIVNLSDVYSRRLKSDSPCFVGKKQLLCSTQREQRRRRTRTSLGTRRKASYLSSTIRLRCLIATDLVNGSYQVLGTLK